MIGVIVYFSVVVICIYPFSLLSLNGVLGEGKIDPFDRGMSVFFGVLFALFWPAILLGILSYKISKKLWVKVVGEEKQEHEANR